ncbi:hypothetical protein GN316_13875 [Xylophilus sp. Kf1]|nr:hypothetical protein [Xylophilus sp. Kf1]
MHAANVPAPPAGPGVPAQRLGFGMGFACKSAESRSVHQPGAFVPR